MNFFKSLFWWAWADDEENQRRVVQQIKRQEVQQPVQAQHETGEASIDAEVDDFDNQEQEEFFN